MDVSRITQKEGNYQRCCPHLRPQIYNSKTDIWSFGVTLYEIVTHDEPYKGMDPVQTAIGVTKDEAPLILHVPAYSPPILREFMQSCLNRNPDLVKTCDVHFINFELQRPEFHIISHRVNYSTIEDWMSPRVMGAIDNSSSSIVPPVNTFNQNHGNSNNITSSKPFIYVFGNAPDYAAMPRMPDQL